MIKKNIAINVKQTFTERIKELIQEIHKHRRFWSTICAVGATISVNYGYIDAAAWFGAASASFASWSLVLPKK